MPTQGTHRTQPRLSESVGGWIASIVVWAAVGALLLGIAAVLLGSAE